MMLEFLQLYNIIVQLITCLAWWLIILDLELLQILIFQSGIYASGVISNVLVFCLDNNDNRNCMCSQHSLVKFKYI